MSARTGGTWGGYWSDECRKGGNGICDGIVDDDDEGHGHECVCPCHREDWGATLAAVESAHYQFWKG